MFWFQNIPEFENIRVLNMSYICRLSYKYVTYFMIDVWQYSEYAFDSEYARVPNVLGLHKILNKILHHRYFTELSLCLEFWICQCYTELCGKQPIINVWLGFEYSSGSQYATAWICKGCEYAKVTQASV